MKPVARAHTAAIADVLIALAEDIELLGATLCADPAVIGRHLRELQTIDLIAQKQRSLAQMLRSDCPVSALSIVELDELKAQIQAILAYADGEPAPAEGAETLFRA